MKWGKVKIKDIGTTYDGPHATPAETNAGPVFLGIKNMTEDGRLDLTEIRHISDQEYPKWTKRVNPQVDDVVFTYEATLHRYGLIPENFTCCLGRRTALVRPDQQVVVPKFLLYYFLSPQWRSYIESRVIVGATVDRISIKEFPEYQVDLPALDVQQRIADILSAYDDFIENNLHRIQLLEEAARCRYKLMIGENETCLMKLGEVCDLIMGQSPPSATYNEKGNGLPFHQGVTNFGSRFLTHATFCSAPVRTAEPGDILISVRAPVGRLNFTTDKICLGRGVAAIRHRKGYQQFQHQVLKEFFFVEDRIGNGSTFNATTKKELEGLLLPYPAEEVMAQFERIAVPMHNQMVVLNKQVVLLRQARDILLPRLMSGEIDVASVESLTSPLEVAEM